jgi:hypothetical protein
MTKPSYATLCNLCTNLYGVVHNYSPKIIIYYRQAIPYSEVKIIIKQSYNIVILDIPLCVALLKISMYLPSTQLFIDITIRYLEYMTTCFDPHLCHLQANCNLRKILA